MSCAQSHNLDGLEELLPLFNLNGSVGSSQPKGGGGPAWSTLRCSRLDGICAAHPLAYREFPRRAVFVNWPFLFCERPRGALFWR
jgi:hypothetical protein